MRPYFEDDAVQGSVVKALTWEEVFRMLFVIESIRHTLLVISGERPSLRDSAPIETQR